MRGDIPSGWVSRYNPVDMPRKSRDRYIQKTIAGRFHIKRPLANGGMSRVYVARDNTTDSRVAIKLLPPRPDGDNLIERMQREAEALSRLDHPNIVKPIASGPMEDGGYYIAMELIDGPKLTDFIRDNQTDPEESIQLLLQVCSALRHTHRKGVIHRDLKSSNILVSREGRKKVRVKLIDFGVVKLTDETTLSGGHQILGSVHTISPEQVRGDEVDHRADIYSLGVLAYRLMAGKYPYHSRITAQVLSMHIHAEIPLLNDPMLPTGMSELVARCMAKDPSDRFDDIQQLMDGLSQILEVPTAAFTKPFKTSETLPPTALMLEGERRAGRIAMAAGAILLAATALFWILT